MARLSYLARFLSL